MLLALLLHVWLVLMFGNPAGTASAGEGVWGRLSVRLRGAPTGAPGATLAANPDISVREWPDNGAPGTALRQRQGGQPRPIEPTQPIPKEAGAAALGRWNVREVQPDAARTEEPSAAAPAQPSPSLPTPATLTLPDGFQPVQRQPASDNTALPAARANASAADLTTDLPTAVQRLEPRDAALTRLPKSQPSRLPDALSPALPSVDVPAPVQRLESVERTWVPLPRAADLRLPSRTGPALVTAPATDLPAPVRRLEANDGSVAPVLPQQGDRIRLPPPAGPDLTDLSAALPDRVAAPQPGVIPGEAVGAADARSKAAANAANVSATDGAKASAGSPEAGSRLGRDLATPPSAAASAPRAPLNLSLPRSGALAARRGAGLLELIPQPPDPKGKLEKSIDKAAKEDCRDAYRSAGLLAVVPLAVDALRDKGCRW